MDQLTDAIQRYYDDRAQTYDEWTKRWLNIDRSVMIPHVRHARRLIEFGCGTGLNLLYINQDTEYIGLDVSGQMLKKARHRLRGRAGRVVHTPAFEYNDTARCDIALATFFFSVDPHWERDMKRLVTHVRPGGRVVFIDHCYRNPGAVRKALGGVQYMTCRSNYYRDIKGAMLDCNILITGEDSLGCYGRHFPREVRMFVGIPKKEN
ncbi:methyltransferase [Candidatus Woesearchaeota archaeon]|nr:methyltransferase [Candidatus Woesearchaeota archaeon]